MVSSTRDSRENKPTPCNDSELRKDLCSQEPNQTNRDFESEHLFLAFDRVCCINLRRRQDRWKTFCSRMESNFGERGKDFRNKIERFDAVDGAALFDGKKGTNRHDHDDDFPCRLEWDASMNARYDRHIKPPMKKYLTPGEVGCVMSHVHLWREALNFDKLDSRMLILEDDIVPYQGRKTEETGCRVGFIEAFSSLSKVLPSDWDILYLGFCNVGKRIPVVPSCYEEDTPASVEIILFQPTYGFYTHAYALSKLAASVLLSNLPVCGPLDVWLADNQWFGLKVYCGAVANEGYDGRGASLISQKREDSDIVHSAHHV